MSTPIRSGASSPMHNEPDEQSGTAASTAASPVPTAREHAIPEFMRSLLRNRSPVRNAEHAQLRLEELHEYLPQSTEEADRLLHGFTASFHLSGDDPLHIDHETYRLLLERLQAMAKDLPPVRQSEDSQRLTNFAGLIHLMDHDDHLGTFATVLKAVGEQLPHDQQRVPLLALIKETGELSEGLQTILRRGLLDYITRLPMAHQHVPMQAFADRLGESARQIRLPEHFSNLEAFRSLVGDIEKLPNCYRSEPLTRLVTAIGRQPPLYREALMAMVETPIRRLPSARRHGPLQAFSDLLD
ncbi:hypothetical protein BLA23254_06739 [Burkholderia lata]|uniref:Uncharacterized protein n=1 Tax=Burkholderia lata (strain ATCC 17760 / DSM 23089 / LMG 22485 / NCIMB 9086 / R18194 / 383) TaxID=482957 RepID=A0A6P2S116_BURL3|nr:hypothetical protein [Burkholderia lata]VWC37726.1 hypothetical protein BLA23254_06739 [Burkholderia lata]